MWADQALSGWNPVPPDLTETHPGRVHSSPGDVGAIGDRNVTGYADLSEGSDLSTNRVIASRHQQTGDPS